MTSSSLWLMSGILVMLKRDRFQPSDPALFNTALSSVSAALSRQARTAATGSGFLRAKRRESFLAHTTLPVPKSQKRSLTTTPGSSSVLFASEVVSQVHSSSQFSSNLALLRSLRRGRSAPASSSSPLSGPRLPSFTRGRPYEKRSSSSSRSGGRQRFRVVRGGSFFRTFGFPEVGAISFPHPFWRLSVPPLAGLEGQGCGALACRGAEGGLLSALPQRSSSFQCSHPNAFLQPHLHHRGCSGGGHLGLLAKGAVELAPLPSPGFYSHLFVVWKTSGSWRQVIDLSHLHRFVDVSPFQLETIQSVLLSVRQGDWMASIDLKEAYLQVPVHPTSRRFLRFMLRDTVCQFKAPVSAILHSMGIRMRRYLDDWLVLSASRESLLRVLHPSQVVQYLGVIIDSTSFRASQSEERISRCSLQPQSFSPAPRLPRASGSRYSAYFLRWLT